MAQSSLGDIWILRERDDEGYSTFTISGLKSVLPIDADTFVEMSVLCFGNDFMPALAMFSLRNDGYNRALHYFKQENPLQNAAKDEHKILHKFRKETDHHVIANDLHALEERYGAHIVDGVIDWEPVAEAFWKTYQWTLHYFKTSEVLDWCWYYPYPEAPLLKTLVDFPKPDVSWNHTLPPYTVEHQLKFILPQMSLQKAGYASIFPDELYDEPTETRHPWMKRFAWECDPFMSLPWNPMFPPTIVVECLSK